MTIKIMRPQGADHGVISRIGVLIVCIIAASAPWATFKVVYPISYPLPFALAGLLAVVVIAEMISRKRIPFPLPIATMATFCVIVGVSYHWTVEPMVWRTHFAWWTVCFLMFSGTLIFIRSEAQIKALAHACVVGAVLTGLQLSNHYWAIAGDAYAVADHNPNLTAYVLTALAFVIVATLRFAQTSKLNRWVFFSAVSTIAVEIVLLKSRGAQISLLLAVGAAFIAPWLKVWMRFAVAWVMVAAVAVASSGIILQLMGRMDVATGDPMLLFSPREYLWSQAIQIFEWNAWLGIGPGGFSSLNILRMEAHNVYLSVLVAFGLVGMAAFLAIVATAVLSMLKTERDKGSQLILILTAFILPITCTGYVDVIPMLWVSLAFAISVPHAIWS